MAKPILKVEIAFDAGVAGTPTWTDVTAIGKVRVDPGVTINHWRGQEDDQCQPSRLSLTLRNDDGRFTPGNAASPYYPNVKMRRRIRVTSTLNGETFYRFAGYIDDWQVGWPATVGAISDCEVTASSRMAVLGRGAELRLVPEEEAMLRAPIALYPLTESAEATAASDVSGNARPPLIQVGSGSAVTFGATLGTFSSATFSGGKNLDVDMGSSQVSAGSAFSLHAVFSATTGNFGLIAATYATRETVASKTIGLAISDSDGKLKAGGVSEVGTPLSSPGRVDDGSLHVATYTFSPSTGSVLYLDGVAVASNPSAFGGPAIRFLQVGGKGSPGLEIDDGLRVSPLTGNVALVSVHSTTLSASAASDLARAALTGFAGETAGSRLARYASYVDIPSSECDFMGGKVPSLARIDTAGRSALDAMHEVETTEGGVLFDALDGTLTFHDRSRRYEAAAFGTLLFGGFFGGGPHGTEFTLSVAQGHIAAPPFPVLDDQRQVNDMTNTNADGVTGRQLDQASIDDHGFYRDGLSLATTDPDEPLLRASWTVTKYAEPLTRVSEVEVNILTLPDDLAAVVLEAQVGTIFTIADLPSNAPSSVMHLFVEGRTDRITATEDKVILRTTPVEVSEVFTIGDPVRGAIGSDYPLAY